MLQGQYTNKFNPRRFDVSSTMVKSDLVSLFFFYHLAVINLMEEFELRLEIDKAFLFFIYRMTKSHAAS
jgi:hypothetical protein